MNSNVRAQKMLDKIQAATGLSDDGRIQLVQLINPFADFVERRVGCSDTNESASIVQAVKLSQTISKPAGVTGNWDVNIFTTPITNPVFLPQQGRALGAVAVTVDGTAAATNNYGGVTYISGPANSNLLNIYSNSTATATNTMDASQLSPSVNQLQRGNSTFAGGNSRVIGMGFEVHNTTAELHKQGSVCVYRYPQACTLDRHTQTLLAGAGSLTAPTNLANRGNYSVYPVFDCPAGVANALILTGSQQWEAGDGCMIVPTLKEQIIDVCRLETLVPQVKSGLYFPVTLPGAGNVNMEAVVTTPFLSSTVPPITIATPVSGINLYPSFKMNPFNTSGAYFSGLSEETTLTINSIFYIERFPTYQEQDLVTLANPSPPYDPLVMSLYTSIMRSLPVGVKVADNADGDWFFDAVSSVADFLQPALKAIPGYGVPLSAAAGAVSSMAKKKKDSRNTREEVVEPRVPASRRLQQGWEEAPGFVPPPSTWKAPKRKAQPKGNGSKSKTMAKAKAKPKPRPKR